MPEYSARIDEQISEALRLHGRVTVGDVPGFSDEEGALLLRRYVEVHGAQVPLRFDGAALTWDTPPSPPAEPAVPAPPVQPPAQTRLSPVDQVLAQPVGKSLLDSASSGSRVHKAMWALPILLGFIGGLIAWALTREENPRVARTLLITGVVVQVATFCVSLAIVPLLAPFTSQMSTSGSSTTWPESATGRPTLYYFGTAT